MDAAALSKELTHVLLLSPALTPVDDFSASCESLETDYELWNLQSEEVLEVMIKYVEDVFRPPQLYAPSRSAKAAKLDKAVQQCPSAKHKPPVPLSPLPPVPCKKSPGESLAGLNSEGKLHGYFLFC